VSVVEDIVDYLAELDIVERGVDIFTEADLNLYKDRPSSAIVTARPSPKAPSLTSDVDYHSLTVAVVTGQGEKGYTAGQRMSELLYRTLRMVLDVTINGTFYPCVLTTSAPYVVSVDDNRRTQYNFDVDVIRYIGD